jgi:hypothetical protein
MSLDEIVGYVWLVDMLLGGSIVLTELEEKLKEKLRRKI